MSDSVDTRIEEVRVQDRMIGTIIRDRYRIKRLLGEGGMGRVYLGEQLSIGRSVAIKLIHASFAEDEGFERRFRDEARQAASIDSDNVVEIYDFGRTEDGSLFIVMEYVPGRSLRQMIPAGGFPLDRAIAIARNLASALEAVHRAQVIHRDVKPENVVIKDDGVSVKLLDFGVARPKDRKHTLAATKAGLVVGTPGYIAPEQIRGAPVTYATDLYAWSVVFYEMLSGELPFEAPTPEMLVVKQATEDARDLRRLRSDVPAAIEQLLSRCLDREPGRRPRDMTEVIDLLDRAQGARPVASVSGTAGFEAPDFAASGFRPRGSRAPLAVMTVLAVMLAGTSLALWRSLAQQSSLAPEASGERSNSGRSITELEKTIQTLEEKAAPLEKVRNGSFRVCNESAGPVTISWLTATYWSPDGKSLSTFNSASHGRPSWMIPAHQNRDLNFVEEGNTIWPGQVAFFALHAEYAGNTYEISSPWSGVKDGCARLEF